VINQLVEESDTAKGQFGGTLADLQIQATVTNLVNYPITTAGDGTHYWCVLTRFDDFSVTRGERWFQIHANRTTHESAQGAYAAVVNEVSAELGTVKPTEQPNAPDAVAGADAAADPAGG
jgi:hypothetical protein